jgi:hypothetical protein
VHQAALKAKYNPIFEKLEKILHDKKMEYMDSMTSNLESNFEKCTLEKQTLSKLEKSFNQMKPHFKGQLERYLHNIDHNIEVQNAIDKKEKQ